ncbi:MAG TPA: hypothetical protein VF188_10310 [Longimicrobiales bacterium]
MQRLARMIPLLLVVLPHAAEARQRDVLRERFVYLDDDLTIDVLAQAPGSLHLLRGRPGMIDVTGRTRHGFAGFGLSDGVVGRLQLTAVGADHVDYLVVVPEDVRVRIRLPGQELSEVFGPLRDSATYHWPRSEPPR